MSSESDNENMIRNDHKTYDSDDLKRIFIIVVFIVSVFEIISIIVVTVNNNDFLLSYIYCYCYSRLVYFVVTTEKNIINFFAQKFSNFRQKLRTWSFLFLFCRIVTKCALYNCN